MARIEIRAQQTRPVVQMDLSHARHIHQGEQFSEFDEGSRLLVCLALGALCRGLAQFHEAGWQCPLAPAWLDVSLAQQNVLTGVAPIGDGADNIERVLVVDGLALGAYRPLAGIPIVWQSIDHGRAAFPAVFDLMALHTRSVGGKQKGVLVGPPGCRVSKAGIRPSCRASRSGTSRSPATACR